MAPLATNPVCPWRMEKERLICLLRLDIAFFGLRYICNFSKLRRVIIKFAVRIALYYSTKYMSVANDVIQTETPPKKFASLEL